MRRIVSLARSLFVARVARESQIQTLSFVVARARVARSPVARAPSTHRALDRVLRSREVPHVPRHRARRRRAAPSSAARASPIARAPPTRETVARPSSRVFEYARSRVHYASSTAMIDAIARDRARSYARTVSARFRGRHDARASRVYVESARARTNRIESIRVASRRRDGGSTRAIDRDDATTRIARDADRRDANREDDATRARANERTNGRTNGRTSERTNERARRRRTRAIARARDARR